MLNLAGYQENEQLYAGTRTLVYRAIQQENGQSVIIKVLCNRYPNFNELVQFRNQYTITKHLDHPNVLRPLALKRYGNGYALIMPDTGAIALHQYWQQTDRSLSEFLMIAIQLADALDYLTEQGIIHKDIKPANILIGPQTHQIQLIDFSISSLLPKQQQQMTNPNVLEGTLAYISPEQTGRMNRGIDYRSDFYSLGVTFYELLTRVLPFGTKDPMELIHCHIAQDPLAPNDFFDNSGNPYPETISEIILKLMAKKAEDRYQSALGLKHDLEQCLQQLQSQGKIDNFELGQRDRCSRFSIPEKLYGRDAEIAQLLGAFNRIATPPGEVQLILIAGFSGIGKTAVVKELHKPIVKNRGYFINGKFDQFNRNIPLSAFVQALRNLIGQLLSASDAELKIWKEKILKGLGNNAQVIIDVIPELQHIIGQQPPVPELSGNAAKNRFNQLFEKLIRVLATKEHPLTIFLDDLQWADSGSLNLLKCLINLEAIGYLLVLGAYRDNEVFPVHPLMLTLEEIAKQGANIQTLTLPPLDETEISHLVADTLLCSTEIAAPLSELVYQKTQGNPFFSTQFLKGLYDDGCIIFDMESGYWQCDLMRVRQLSLTDDVVEFTIARLRKLPKQTQTVLKLAACMGNRFDLSTLALICDRRRDEVAGFLWTGLQEGFVIPENETYKFFQGDIVSDRKAGDDVSVNYRFLHDRIQQAAYALIPESQKQQTHLRIGQLLFRHLNQTLQNERIFEIVNHLNHSISLIDSIAERQQYAQLNLKAGRKAKQASAYELAFQYLDAGIELLTEKGWDLNADLMHGLYEEAAEAALLNSDFEQMDSLIHAILQRTNSIFDRLKVYQVQIQAYQIQNQQIQAVKIGREILQQLGTILPESVTPFDIQQQVKQTLSSLPSQTISDLAKLPPMEDANAIAALQIIISLVPSIHQSCPFLFPIVAAEQVNLSLKYGNSPFSAPGYADFGIVVSAVLNQLEQGYQFGQLALQILDKFSEKSVQSMVQFKVAAFTQSNQEPIERSLALLKDAYKCALETGDSMHALGSTSFRLVYSYLTGLENLETLWKEVQGYQSKFANSEQFLTWMHMIRYSMDHFMKSNDRAVCLGDDLDDEHQFLSGLLNKNDALALHLFYLSKLVIGYSFDDFTTALNRADEGAIYLPAGMGMPTAPLYYYYDSLARLSLYPNGDWAQQKKWLSQVEENQQRLKVYANAAPMNYQHKYHLVAAVKCQRLHHTLDAIELYDRAIFGAKENEYIHDEALANELAAKFYLDWSKEKFASLYMQEAYYCYARWGASAKTDQLETNYPQLLGPILQQQTGEKIVSTLDSLTNTTTVIKPSTASSTFLSDTLDFHSILKAAQALSIQIDLPQLLAEISTIILTNAGAQKVVLLTPYQGQWQIRAIAQITPETIIETNTDPQPLSADSPVPIRLIQYVKHTLKPVLIDAARSDIPELFQGYVLSQQPESAFCLPLVHQGKLVAILYLEHRTIEDVFTRDRQMIIKFLCTQAAISLKNAQLYDQAQQSLRDLQQAHQKLQEAQLRVVQSEKMSALGNLVAGVAHEINNPIGFLQGNLQPAQDYLKDLLDLIDLYQKKLPNADEELESSIEAIDLEFVREDFPELLKSMNLGLERIRNISTSLRTFSRTDEEHKTHFNIDDGIESTLLILKHRTKANEKRPGIEIVKEYGEIPELYCFPGQLNQVFMNLLANCIDAVEDSNEGKTYEEIAAKPNCIIIRTSVIDSNWVQIEIQDNGCGMNAETKERIFQQGFTTKGVGKGTGLGMAIAREIVEQKHGGTITCTSQLHKGTKFTISLPILSSLKNPDTSVQS